MAAVELNILRSKYILIVVERVPVFQARCESVCSEDYTENEKKRSDKRC